jgi:hypothetical protein
MGFADLKKHIEETESLSHKWFYPQDGTSRLRIVSDFVSMYKKWDGSKTKVVPDRAKDDAKVTVRFACWCYLEDEEVDGPRFRLFEFGEVLLKEFDRIINEFDIDVESIEDLQKYVIVIERETKEEKGRVNTIYSAQAENKMALSDELKKEIEKLPSVEDIVENLKKKAEEEYKAEETWNSLSHSSPENKTF